MAKKKLLLLDAYALIFRAYYALIRAPRTTTTGIDTSAIFGFVNTLQDLLKRELPTHIGVCFDPQGPTFRHKAFEQYKATRKPTPEGIKNAVPWIKQILEAYNIPIYQVDGFEADDVIGTLSSQAPAKGFLTYMVTGDKDFGQLVTDEVKIYHPGKYEILGPAEIDAKYGLNNPKQVIDLLGLMGDTADNIPGCPGVGPKTAEKLIQQYGSIENLLDHASELKGALQRNIQANVEQIKFSKFLATIRTDAPITLNEDDLLRRPADFLKLRDLFTQLEFKQLATRIIDHGEANVGLQGAPQPSGSTPSQPSLFDAAPEATQPSTRNSLETTPHDFSIVADASEAEPIIARMLAQPQLGVCIIAQGEEAMRARMAGIALCARPGEAVYFPLDDMGWMLAALKPVFTSTARIASNDVKRDIVMLHCAGIEFAAPYYDTAVAHYLMQPERDHDTASIAAEALDYDAITADSILGGRGKSRLSWLQVKPEKIKDYACEQASLTLQLPQVLDQALASEGMTQLLTSMEMPLVQVLAAMEIAGARIDVKALNDYAQCLTKEIDALDRQCHEMAGREFNTASPAQVGEVLFDTLKLDDRAKRTKSGQYSTTEEVLLHLQGKHPIVGKILELRGKRKLLSTYVNVLPSLINPRTGRIHTTFNQTVTATGRLSSTNPNLQNIPVRTDEGKEIRRAFIPAEGNVFFSADYSQIELRLVADMSHDQTMLDAFAGGEDIHAITASKIYHEPLDKVTPDQRRRAKTANFGILYGISAFGLAERLSIPRSEAKQLIDGYFATFPGVRHYIDESVAHAKQKGYVTTLYGRRRMLPDINSRNATVRSFSERNAVNAPIQGTAADVIKLAMVDIYRRFKQEGIKSKMILQVHDELNFDVLPEELERVQSIVIGCMEGVYHGNVRLTASHGAASNWLDAH